MRFAYIDSKGKEIELDSVEALALRIELGAITDETKLYDASQDRWAPAQEHPIFQSLSSGKPVKEAGEAAPEAPEAKAAPPEPKVGGPPKPKKKPGPPKPKKKAEPPKAEEAARPPEEKPEEEAEAEEAELSAAAAAFMGPGMEGAKAEVHEPEAAEDVEPVSFADVMDEEPEEEPTPEPEEEPAAEPEEEAPSFETEEPLDVEEPAGAPAADAGDEGVGDVLDMDMDLVDTPEPEKEPEAVEAEAEAADDELPSFDMEGPLELEEDEASPAVPGTRTPEPDSAGEPTGPGGGMELEGALDWAGLEEGEAGVGEEAAAPETARERGEMFGPEVPAAEEADEPPGDEGLELEPAHAASATTKPDAAPSEEAERERKRPAAPRPSHWEDRKLGDAKSGGIGKILVGLVLLAALGGGAWYFLMGPGASQTEVDAGPVLPPAPGLRAELVPTMNSLAGGAMETLVERTDALWTEGGAPEGPGQSWLRGPYFANASEYAYIGEYWETMQGFVADLRERDDALFREVFETRLEAAAEAGEIDVSEADMGAIVDRAEWEFVAATVQTAPYAPLDSLARAALGLHELLLTREADILTEDEAGGFGSADPILEVIVQDDALRSAMNDRLDAVLRTVAETEAPTPVTTRALMAAAYEKIRAAAFP